MLVEDVALGQGTTIYGLWGRLIDLLYAAGLLLTFGAAFLLRPQDSQNPDTPRQEEN